VEEAEARKQREQAFHDQVFTEHSRAPMWKYYSIVGKSRKAYSDLVARDCHNKTVLEYGCGPTSVASLIARRGAAVTSIDLSTSAVEQARAMAKELNLAPSVSILQMDAENLSFPDSSFDMVCGTSILHHLDLNRAYGEIARVLKPEGQAIFSEPLGLNPVINLYRRLTPRHRTVDEHPLVRRDLDLARSYFGHVRVSFFHLATLAAMPLYRTPLFSRAVKALDDLDLLLFKLPNLRYYSWMCVMELSRPR
jgi:SAM-dependent methyltransferase